MMSPTVSLEMVCFFAVHTQRRTSVELYFQLIFLFFYDRQGLLPVCLQYGPIFVFLPEGLLRFLFFYAIK